MLQDLVGFTYATSLDLNMGYYTLRLDGDAQNIYADFTLGKIQLLVPTVWCKIVCNFHTRGIFSQPLDGGRPPNIFRRCALIRGTI